MTGYASDLEGRKDEPCLLIYGSSCNFVILPSRQPQQHQQAWPALQMSRAVRKRRRVKPDMWEQSERSRLQLG